MNRSVPIACQTITFGERQREFLPAVFRSVADAGFTGVEIGFRHVAERDPRSLVGDLRVAGLSLAAVHAGGNLADTGQAGGERGALDRILAWLAGAGCRLLLYSGLRVGPHDEPEREVAVLARAARRCAGEGVQMLFHNHWWEFADGRRIMDVLLRSGGTDLGLCPDIGWLHVAGVDAVAFLREHRDRVGALHFKDFSACDTAAETVPLGTGGAPLAQGAAWLAADGRGLWAIAEQDRCRGAPADAVAANAAFLRAALGPGAGEESRL